VVVAGAGGGMLLGDVEIAAAISDAEKSTMRKEVMRHLKKSVSSEHNDRGSGNDR
jgi:hypothetical protein